MPPLCFPSPPPINRAARPQKLLAEVRSVRGRATPFPGDSACPRRPLLASSSPRVVAHPPEPFPLWLVQEILVAALPRARRSRYGQKPPRAVSWRSPRKRLRHPRDRHDEARLLVPSPRPNSPWNAMELPWPSSGHREHLPAGVDSG